MSLTALAGSFSTGSRLFDRSVSRSSPSLLCSALAVAGVVDPALFRLLRSNAFISPAQRASRAGLGRRRRRWRQGSSLIHDT